jgi:uncharacterized repeat protein (TIGR03803 family)
MGTVWELPNGSNTVQALAAFQGPNGASPDHNGVTLDAAGNLFGATLRGGTIGFGTVWEIPHDTHTLQTLALFDGTNELHPFGGVTLDSHGNLWGTTEDGGLNQDGVVWRIDNVEGTTAVPAPSSLTLLTMGLVSMAAAARFKRRQATRAADPA